MVGADQRVCPKESLRRYPAEWEKQACVWLSCPHNEKEWEKKRLPELKQFYVELIKVILRFQDVNLILANEGMLGEDNYPRIQNGKHKLKKIIIPNNDIWIRDYGPFFVGARHGTPLLLDFEFNAWGGKFPPWNLDNNIPKQIALYKGCEIESYPVILEGGAVDFNGNGLVITTEQCLLNKNRNKNLKKEQFEKILTSAFNLDEIIWLKRGLHKDHTDGHIDNVARFIDKRKILVATTKNKKDKNYEILQENLECLKKKDFELIEIPLPVGVCHGKPTPASYVNFIFVNDGVIVPTFNCKTDKIALDIFKKIFPKRKIVGIDCSLLVQEGGGLHCMTKQESLI